MSNCVQIEDGGDITISRVCLDDEFFSLVAEATRMPNSVDVMTEAQKASLFDGSELGMCYWFLCANVQVSERGGVSISLGSGRSTHTMRDLQGTIRLLDNHYRGPKHHINLYYTEEGDDFSTLYQMEYTLGYVKK